MKNVKAPDKPRTVRHLGEVDITKLREMVSKLEEQVWEEENEDKPNKFGALNKTRHIVFRFIVNSNTNRFYYNRPVWEEWEEVLQPVLDQATQAYNYSRGAYPRIMLAKLPAGTLIHKHIDGSNAARLSHKIHVPLQTNEECYFFVNEEPFRMLEGQAYEVNNLAMHWAENRGKTDRIHLIFEYFSKD
ncbi:MAG: aspartyl beta-hydroxylase [Owenweeksia sp.]|nr:aspartyl beta-hydroxylase [Owenweeksia sp.]